MTQLSDLDILFIDTEVTAVIDGGDPVPVIFWVPGKTLNMFEGGVNSTDPGFLAKTADLGSADNSTAITIAGAVTGNGSYTIIDIQPDGTGLSVVSLTRA